MKPKRTGMMVIAAALIFVFVFALFAVNASSPTSASATKGNMTSQIAVYILYQNGTRVKLSTLPPFMQFSTISGGGGGGSTAFQFVPGDSVSFSGDTITGGSCSGTVSFNSPGGIAVASQSESGTGGASTSPMACTMTAATVPFSDFTSLPSGTYTLTATLASSASVTFTHGGPDSGVAFSAPSISVSVSFTASGGVVSGVSGTI